MRWLEVTLNQKRISHLNAMGAAKSGLILHIQPTLTLIDDQLRKGPYKSEHPKPRKSKQNTHEKRKSTKPQGSSSASDTTKSATPKSASKGLTTDSAEKSHTISHIRCSESLITSSHSTDTKSTKPPVPERVHEAISTDSVGDGCAMQLTAAGYNCKGGQGE
ncbi:hypothetical protein SARC_17486 [Sphaeroforma arctica JP610]|uniref:Uncharacterized protein n=1 Tax=Sphaeroforma arctica JP610 TaxID=667725 RepID=A0A0L0EZS6_9EUKA|nr:hypothetical protein SARC_17486 [Sphaeroforma arctica JP610]KNC69995.1 hypothetical protein SARC_17486 [Sphaeroforma arctica JP610]|eukprot:XP_014143897.1 hypothetical protein SARC_17486 [Sphaeroforma arctica JP610]